MTQEEKDKSTCGQVREFLEARLADEIKTLAGILQSRDVAGAKLAKAESYLKGAVAERLADLEKLDTFASLPGLKKLLGG